MEGAVPLEDCHGLVVGPAIHDQELQARVILLEKEPLPGGNTKLAAGGMNAAETKSQAALGIEARIAFEFLSYEPLAKRDPALGRSIAAIQDASLMEDGEELATVTTSPLGT